MEKNSYIILLTYLINLTLSGCAGTINTTNFTSQDTHKFHKAYVISSKNSQYIKFKFGVVTPFGYIVPADDAAKKSEVIGNTDLVIKNELEKYGIEAVIGKGGTIPDVFDLIVLYNDTWRWDFKKILDRLEIHFISPDGGNVLAQSTYNIYQNKELHNFPTPEKEVPKMIKELLNK